MPTKIILDENAYEDLMKKINALDWAMPTGTRWNITYDFNQDFIKRLPSLLFASYWKCQDWENIVFSDCASLFLYLHWLLQINSATIFTLIFQGHLMTSLFHKQVNIIPWNRVSCTWQCLVMIDRNLVFLRSEIVKMNTIQYPF